MYTYVVNIVLTGKFDEIDGKLKITLQSGNSKQTLPLNANPEKLKSGMVKTFNIAANLDIASIDRVSLEWSRKKKVIT